MKIYKHNQLANEREVAKDLQVFGKVSLWLLAFIVILILTVSYFAEWIEELTIPEQAFGVVMIAGICGLVGAWILKR